MQKMTAAQTVLLVAGRELKVSLRAKGTIITTAIMVAAIIGGLFLIKFLGSAPTSTFGALDDTQEVAQISAQTLESQGIEAQVISYTSVEEGRAAVEAGDIEGLIVRTGNDITLDVNESADPQLLTAITGAAQQDGVKNLATQYGSEVVTAVTDVFTNPIAVNVLNPPTELDGSQMAVGFIVGFLLYLGIFGGGMAVAQGVVEEKSSRVVEILLASIKPWQLLAGKVIGIGLSSLIQVATYVIAAVVTATALGITKDFSFDIASVGVWVLIWFLIGYLVYALIFAALGALVSRQEDLGTVIMLPMMLVVIAYLIGVSVAPNAPDSLIVQIASYVPFTSPIVMPIRSAYGVASTPEVMAAIGIGLVTIPLLLWLCAKIYSNGVRRSGAKIKLKDALKAS
ncbi:ABC transporter permease [Jonesiaceae bacterium BS-20]|uniref:ABC transporter permease n=1 Tax=Jonesiaceae bacterium BS-20 TaxID=3120821 RepID=A0AAU7DVX2_9MICO